MGSELKNYFCAPHPRGVPRDTSSQQHCPLLRACDGQVLSWDFIPIVTFDPDNEPALQTRRHGGVQEEESPVSVITLPRSDAWCTGRQLDAKRAHD